MINIAICDDDEGCCSQIETWLLSYPKREKIDLQISVFNSAETMMQSINKKIVIVQNDHTKVNLRGKLSEMEEQYAQQLKEALTKYRFGE